MIVAQWMLRVVPVVAVLGLAACNGPMVSQQSSRTIPITALYSYGAGDRDLALVVRGNPFTEPQATLDQAVERGVAPGGILQPPTHPRLAPQDARPGYQLVLVFQGAPTVDGAQACAGAPGGLGRSGDNLTVVAAFCVSGRAVSEATGRVVAANAEDPQFTALMQAMASEIFRPDEFQGGNGGTESH
jgi:hypothetical protein